MQTSQEYFTTIVYAKFGGQTDGIMDNWKIVNSNWTEWSTIQAVIGRVISKSAEREARLRARLLPELYDTNYNYNYNKIREEYDSGLNYLTGLYIQLLSYMPKKKAIQVQLARAR